MFLRPNPEDLTAKNDAAISELEDALAFLEKELSQVYTEVGYTPEDIEAILSDDTQATEEQRKLIEQTREEIRAQITLGRDHCVHVATSQNTRNNLPKDSSWIAAK